MPKTHWPDFEEHIFINYAWPDNESLLDDFKPFVDQLHEVLKKRLRMLLGEEPKIWRDILLGGADQLTEAIFIKLSKTAFLMCILSPSYISSGWCKKELNGFYQSASRNIGIKINNRSRIFKVVKTPIGTDPAADPLEGTDLPEELRTVLRESLGYHFYERDKQTGKVREFWGEFGREYERKYLVKVDDLAQDIVRFIQDEELQNSGNKCIYLAETTPELAEERNDIRRNLLQHGYNVFPDENLPFESEAFDKKVSEYLEHCALSIHLVGSDFTTMQPEEEQLRIDFDAQHHLCAARVRRQHELAMIRGENDDRYSRLVWMPTGLTPRETENQDFVAYLQNDPVVQENAEILSAAKLEDLKTIIQKRLNITWEEDSVKAKSKRIYLICDKPDKDAVRPLKDFLQENQCEVSLPFSDGDQVSRSHRENLRWCDAILIFYGTYNTMAYKLTDLRKVNVLRDNKPLLATAIYVGGLETEEKKKFSTDEVLLMKRFGDFSPDSIKPFLDQLEKGN